MMKTVIATTVNQQWPKEFAGYQRDLERMIYLPEARSKTTSCC